MEVVIFEVNKHVQTYACCGRRVTFETNVGRYVGLNQATAQNDGD